MVLIPEVTQEHQKNKRQKSTVHWLVPVEALPRNAETHWDIMPVQTLRKEKHFECSEDASSVVTWRRRFTLPASKHLPPIPLSPHPDRRKTNAKLQLTATLSEVISVTYIFLCSFKGVGKKRCSETTSLGGTTNDCKRHRRCQQPSFAVFRLQFT